MLEQLYLKNFAIIDEQTIPFATGFNVLSGETGAGKSILVDALGLQLGDRADSSWIRHGTTRCDIQSEFVIGEQSLAMDWVKRHEFDDARNCTLQLRRTLSQGGKSRCYINGIPATVGSSKVIAEMLLDIYGQHAHQSLTKPQQQLALLDRFANHGRQLQVLKKAYQHWQNLLKQQKQLVDNDINLADKRDLLTYQLEEILMLEVGKDEFATLAAQQKRLSYAHEMLQKINQIDDTLSGDDGLILGMNRVIHELQNLQRQDENIADISELFNQSLIYLDEAQSTLSRYAQHITLNPQALQDTENRMAQLYELARKHRVEPEQLGDLQNNLQRQLDELNNTLKQLDSIDIAINQAAENYYQQAQKLSASRQQAAQQLIEQVISRLAELNLENAHFSIYLTQDNKPDQYGVDKVVFMFAPNPGMGEKPLHKIASGGELSRISLAIQVASVRQKTEATLIFDEVDSGVGGATAEVVGRLLKTLSQYNQVICVTHLAQVAAFADNHIKISKSVKHNETFTQFTTLTDTARIDELARMSGGLQLDKKTREHAQNMRQNALQFTHTLTAGRTR